MKPMYLKLSKATSSEEIVNVTRDYLENWTNDDFERLPAGCWPSRVRDAGDIETWADFLSVESGRALLTPDDEVRLDALTHHFLIASVILRQIANRRCAS